MSKYDERAKKVQYNSMRIYLNEDQANYKELIKSLKGSLGFDSMSEYVVNLIETDLKKKKII